MKRKQEMVGDNSHYRSKMLSHAKRIEILYLFKHHDSTIKHISEELKLNYSTIRTIVSAFRKSGRTNKLMAFQAKQSFLKHKQSYQEAQKQNKMTIKSINSVTIGKLKDKRKERVPYKVTSLEKERIKYRWIPVEE